MKYFFLTIALSFSLNSFSQNDLLGEWFLSSINHNGVQLDNYLTSDLGYTLSLNFNEISENEQGTLVSFDGFSGCNPFTGNYNVEGSSLTLASFAILTGPCNGVIPSRYESKCINIITHSGASANAPLNYLITGTGSNAILKITRTNGDFAVYSKIPATITLFDTWYLTSIDNNGEVVNIPSADSPILNLTTSSDAFSRILFDGNGDCNGFSGYYSIYETDDNALTILEFGATLAICGISYEALYFDIVSNPLSNYLTYEISNDGQTLKLTDLLGRILYFGNEPTSQELLGEWHLHYIEINDVQQYSTIPNSINTVTFHDDNSFNGGVCNNGYGGSYVENANNTLYITNFAAFGGFCNYPIESNLFLFPYFAIFNYIGTETAYDYSISGTGTDQTLTITNSENDIAFYRRTPLPENRLLENWYLHSITKNGNEELNTFQPNFNMDFTLNAGSFSSLVYNGTAVCNDYFGEYHLDGINTIKILGISFTLAICNENGGGFEESYLSFFAESNTEDDMLLNYDITGSDDNESLVLIASNGDYLTYGRQILSVEEYAMNNLSVHIKKNPVRSELKLDIDPSLGTQFNIQIFSIDGKMILKGQLNDNHVINVDILHSGMYFLMVSNETNLHKTLKFVKQ